MSVLNYAQDLFAVFCAVLVRMYLNYTIDHFLDLIWQVSLSDEGNITRKNFWFALDLLHTFLDINCFFMSSLICLMRSIQVNVLLFVQINQNLDHITVLNVH